MFVKLFVFSSQNKNINKQPNTQNAPKNTKTTFTFKVASKSVFKPKTKTTPRNTLTRRFNFLDLEQNHSSSEIWQKKARLNVKSSVFVFCFF